MRNLAGPILAGITCTGWLLSGDPHATAATDPGTTQVQSGTLNPEAEKVSQAGALYASALAREASGDQAGALAEVRQVVALDPSFSEAQIKLASLLLEAKQPDAAYAQLQAALAAHADPNAVNIVLAQVEEARGHARTHEAETEKSDLWFAHNVSITYQVKGLTVVKIWLRGRMRRGLRRGRPKPVKLMASSREPPGL